MDGSPRGLRFLRFQVPELFLTPDESGSSTFPSEKGGARGGKGWAPAPRPLIVTTSPTCCHQLARVLPQLPRRPGQHGQRHGVPHAVDTSLALCVETPEPKASIAVDAFRPTRRQMDSPCPDTEPVPQRAILRQPPEVGAVCGNSARTDLCGPPGATRGPTATDRTCCPHSSLASPHAIGPVQGCICFDMLHDLRERLVG